MKRSAWVSLFCLATVMASVPALAQPRSGADASSQPQATDPKKAQEHFQHAKELYHAGSYKEAIAELELARKLDPKSKDTKDLVMNLGIVNEKLGKYDEAIGYLRSYLDMEGITAAERSKVEGMIKRIEGAKLKAPPTEPTVTPPAASTTAPAPTGAPTETDPPHGRVDALTIAAASVAAIGLVGGTGIGVYALSQRPTDFVTGRDGSYADLQQKADDAHTLALIADIGLGVGVVAAIATAWLYFGRTKEVSASSSAPSATRIHAAPLRSGGAVFVGGTF